MKLVIFFLFPVDFFQAVGYSISTMKNTKITNQKTTVELAKNFNNGTINYKKGHRFDVRNLTENGVVIVCGHGWNEVIPHDYLGKYEATYNEVTTIDDTVTIKKVKFDATNVWKTHWNKLAEKKNAAARRNNIINLKKNIATLRKTIKFVKKGEAEKNLNNLLAELAKIA